MARRGGRREDSARIARETTWLAAWQRNLATTGGCISAVGWSESGGTMDGHDGHAI